MEWVKEELSGIKLGDERLNKRSAKLLESFAAKSSASIPTACGGWSETLAAYRFLGQEGLRGVTFCSRISTALWYVAHPDTRWVYVADGEADILELMQRRTCLEESSRLADPVPA